ncbi:hypothetical protein [Cellulomonas shaoxiangyii]|uniref:SipW-cognate class signal peptide n=1 Tax=Cellulomonas shaoxiangyii TaxID=2566013 RepID=A0A4P7SHD5_9CELL|nr:hypothetical protein [Cellulomonas shaoxiangyii]QCB92927.1 hypothetical protein E5225_04500 [Cellulomonas shaoxiangyii]TGY85385.1 hypothetical protein E5226_06745 [Cellulomonas shaoxiangyii]
MSAATTQAPRRSRLRGAAVVLVALALALLVGTTAGGTLALWRDTATVTTRMPAGVVVVGAGAPAPTGTLADYASGPGDPVEVPFGPAQAATLYTTGAVAVPFQVDTLSQGHRGLRYQLAPQVAGGVFGQSVVRLVRVADAGACTPAVAGEAATTATPWSGAYSTSTALRSELWCLVATFDRIRHTYTNTATVDASVTTSTGAVVGSVSSSASWSAQVLKALDPATEPTHRVAVTWQTFRGATP